MFINNNQEDTFHYRNKKRNYLIIKIISDFIVLINDFNLDNLHKLQNTINKAVIKNISLDSTIDIKDENNGDVSIKLIEGDKIKKISRKNTEIVNFNEANSFNNKNELINKMLENKSNNSELFKLNISSSKADLYTNNSIEDPLNNLNSPQKAIENNNTKNITSNNNKNSFIINSLGNSIISTKKNLTNNLSKKKQSKISNSQNNNKMINNIKAKNDNNDNSENGEKMTVELFISKLENNGIKNIKLSRLALLMLFIVALVYVSVKIYISLDFITEIKGIFEDFNVLSFRYSSMYYYFNSLRTLLVFPDFGSEAIFETMNENMAEKLKKLNVILDTKLSKYPAVSNYYWVAGTSMEKPRPSPEYIDITCYDDQKCREIINNKKYDVLLEGLKMVLLLCISKL